MSCSVLKSLCNSYRSYFFNGRNKTKFIPLSNITSNVNFSRHYCHKSITVIFKLPNGSLVKRSGKAGETVRSTVVENDPDFPGYGTCGGSVSCGSCHVILSEEDYSKLDEPTEAEEDIVGKVHLPTPTSRLGCCLELVPEMDGMVLKIPRFDNK